MKKKAAAFVSAFVSIIIFAASLCFTNARYLSSVTVTETLDCARTAGTIELYHPEWSYGNYYNDNESFYFTSTGGVYGIRLAVTNAVTVNNTEYVNDTETDYYISIVARDESDKNLFSYTVCEYDKFDTLYPKDESGAYGPFKLTTETKSTFYLGFNLILGSKEGLSGIRVLKIRMVRKTGTSGDVKLIGEADLRIKVSDVIVDNKVNLTLCYRKYGSAEIIGNSSITVEKGKEIDFTSAENLKGLGVELPAGYSFRVNTDVSPESTQDPKYLISYATSGTFIDSDGNGWAGCYKFGVTEVLEKQTVDVYLIQDGYIPVDIQYLNRANQVGDSFEVMTAYSQSLLLQPGDVIDFTDESALLSLGITLPDAASYKYIAAHCYGEGWAENGNYYHDVFTARAPADNSVKKVLIDVYIAPIAMRDTVRVYLYNVTRYEDYEDIDEDGNKVTKKRAILDRIEVSGQVENAYPKSTSSGYVTFTYDDIKAMFNGTRGDLGYDKYNSFEICIYNTKNGTMHSIGTIYRGGGNSVTIDCFEIYQSVLDSSTGYCLSNTSMRPCIIAWK